MRKLVFAAFVLGALPASCSAMSLGSDTLPAGPVPDSGLPPNPGADAADAMTSPAQTDASDAETIDAPTGDAGPCDGECDGALCFEGVCGGNRIVQVSAGAAAACALTKAGSVWCWGSDQRDQLGVPVAAAPMTCAYPIIGGQGVACSATPVEVAGLHDVAQVAAGNGAICAVEKDGSVWCWGDNEWGELGHPASLDPDQCGTNKAPCNATPVRVTGSLSATMVSLESSNACALTTSGEVACWGDDSLGQLGAGVIRVSSSTPQIVPGLEGVVKVAVEGTQTCALKGDGTVWCWGGFTDALGVGHAPGAHGDLSCQTGSGSCAASPVLVYQSDDVTPAFGPTSDGGGLLASDIARGPNDGCALVAGGVWCWGSDGEGVVGPAASGSHFYPSSLPLAGGVGLSASNTHACALQGDGGVLCWGQDEWGELGVGHQECDAAAGNCTNGVGCLMPTPVVGLGSVIQISVGFALTVALKGDGTVWAWGLNDTGRLGHAPGVGDVECTVPQFGQTYPCAASPAQVKGLP